MTRSHLLGAVSAAALACISTGAFAQSTIYGGGSTLAQFDYGLGAPNATPGGEFSTFNNSSPAPSASFSTYWESGSGTGQLAFIANDLSCDISKAQGTLNCTQSGVVDYGASDATLSSSQISSWATSSVGQSAAGDLIQLPSMGVAVAIPVNDTGLTKNYKLVMDDNDLCGVFSAKFTNFNQLSGFTKAKIAAGPINVVYRSDGSGTSFLLTNHLSAVCTGSNSNITFTATTSFASLFPNGKPPANFYGESGSSGVASFLNGTSSYGPQPQALGYITPDYTSVDNPSDTLVVAAITSGAVKAGQPTVKDIGLALDTPASGQNLNPPANAAQAANPTAWVPLIQTVKRGYPIVGYTTFDLAQCYNDPNVEEAVLAFLTDHYTNKTYTNIQNSNGFTPVSSKGSVKFLQAIEADILTNKAGYNTNIGNATACSGKIGR
jgi:ABC-type phosphate transport system substrate-binding protein